MSRTSALVALAALGLLTALAAAVGPAGAIAAEEGADVPVVDGDRPAVSPVANTTNYLSLESTDRTAHARADVDVAAAVGVSAQRLHARHDRAIFDARFEAAESESDRVALVRETADDASARTSRLVNRHGALVGAYSDGSLSRETTLRRLSRLSVAAEVSRNALQHVSDRVDESSGTSVPVRLETRISDLQTGIVSLPNPVADRVEAGLAGDRDPLVVYAGGSENGLVLATVDGGEFVRTATVRDSYAPDQPDQLEQAEGRAVILALQRGGELYPWVYENDIGGPQISGFGNTGVYLIRVDYGRGELRTYLSGGTTEPFHEVQTQRPGGVPVTGVTDSASDAVNLTVKTTTASGPMRVQLAQPSTGAPLDGAVAVDGQVVGRTGNDGMLWAVQPDGQFRVNATTGAGSVDTTVP